jgi:hypothetical protein
MFVRCGIRTAGNVCYAYELHRARLHEEIEVLDIYKGS